MTSTYFKSVRSGLGIFAAFLCFALVMPAAAQDSSAPKDMFPPMAAAKTTTTEYKLSPNEATHPMLRLTPDKSEIVRLDQDAYSLIVGNPAHLNVLMDNPRMLVLVGRQPGATHFTALNRDGKVVMQRHVIVAGPHEEYVRIRRRCNVTGVGECNSVSVYYCPDMCHEVQIGAGQNDSADQSSVSSLPAGTTLTATVNGDGSMDVDGNIPGDAAHNDAHNDAEETPASAEPE